MFSSLLVRFLHSHQQVMLVGTKETGAYVLRRTGGVQGTLRLDLPLSAEFIMDFPKLDTREAEAHAN